MVSKDEPDKTFEREVKTDANETLRRQVDSTTEKLFARHSESQGPTEATERRVKSE